jgi:hypothetical protein
VQTCIPLGGCCSDATCSGHDGCAGTCVANRCEYPGTDMSCGDSVCSAGGAAVLTYACDGAGQCVELSETCAPYLCSEGACTTTCTENTECASGLCHESETCCPAEDVCAFSDTPFCCPEDPQDPGRSCCPASSGCCQCFVDSRNGPFCCGQGAGSLCRHPSGDPSQDTCILGTYFACIEGKPEIVTHVCDSNVICDVPCCGGSLVNQGPGGTCCPEGTECSSGVCRDIGRACALSTDPTEANAGHSDDCLTGEICATAGGATGTCCPQHRGYRNTLAESSGAPSPYWECCDVREATGPSVGGDPFCHQVPDFTATHNKSWSR